MVSLEKLKQEGLSPLAYLGYVLDKAGIQASFTPADIQAQRLADQLFVVGGQDKKGDDLILKLLYSEEIATALLKQSGQSLKTNAGSILQFLFLYPHPIDPRLIPDLQHLCIILNRQTPLGYFGANPGDGLFLNYKHIGETAMIEPGLAIRIITTLTGTYTYFQKPLEACLKGEKPLKLILKDLETR
jgi:hypothetical protein